MGERRRLLVGLSASVVFGACNLSQSRLDRTFDKYEACEKNDRGACAALIADCGDGRRAAEDPLDPIAYACTRVIGLAPDDDLPADAKHAFYTGLSLEGATTYATAHCGDNSGMPCFEMSELGTRLADEGDPRALDLLQRACNGGVASGCLVIAERGLKAPPPMSGPLDPTVVAVLDLRTHPNDSIDSLSSEIEKLVKRLAGMSKDSPETPALVRRLAERSSDLAWIADRAGRVAPPDLSKNAHAKAMEYYGRLALDYPTWCASPATGNAPASGCRDESLYYWGFESEKAGHAQNLRQAYPSLIQEWRDSPFVGPAYVGVGNNWLFERGAQRGEALEGALLAYGAALRYPPQKNRAWGAARYGYAYVMAERGDMPRALSHLHELAGFTKADPDRNGFAGAVLRATAAIYARVGDLGRAQGFFAAITASPSELKEVLELQYHLRLEAQRAAVEGCNISDNTLDWSQSRCARRYAITGGGCCKNLESVAKSCRLLAQGASAGEAAKLVARADAVDKRREEAAADRKEAREEEREERAARKAQEAEEDERRGAMLQAVAQTMQATQQSQAQMQENIARTVKQSDEATAQRRRAATQASAERQAAQAEQQQREQQRQAEQQREAQERARQAREEQERQQTKRREHEAMLMACPRIDVAYNLFSHMKMSFDQDARLVADHTKANGWRKTRGEIAGGIVRPSVKAWEDDRESWRPFSKWAQQVEKGCPGLIDRCGAEPYGIDPSAARVTCTAYEDDELCLNKLGDLSADAARLDTFERCAAGYVDEYRQSH
jgi:hypothetical protein